MPRAVIAAALLLCSISVPAREVPLSQPLFEPTGGTRARIASSASGYAVAWVRSGPPHLVVARFDEDGNLLGEFVEPIFPSFSASVDIASDGTDYLVAWSCATWALKGQTCMARVLASGEVQRVAPIIGNAVTVASSGDGYLLVVDEAAGPLSDEVRAYPLDRRGARTGAGYLVATGAADPLIASNGSNYLITWQSSRPSGRSAATATATGLQSPPVFIGNTFDVNLAVVGNMTLYPPDAHSFAADVPSSPVLSRAAGTDVLIFRRVVLSEPPYDGATRYLMSLLPEATRRRAARK